MKKCVACAELIEDHANLCRHCDSFQKNWKNNLRYFSSIVAAISFAFAGASFFITKYPELRKTMNWSDKVEVFALSSLKPLSIGNVGDGSVYISHIHLQGVKPNGSRFSIAFPIRQTLMTGESTIKDIEPVPKERMTAWRKEKEGGGYKFRVAIANSEEERQYKLNNSEIRTENNCFFRNYTVRNDPDFLTFSEAMGKTIITFPLDGYVSLYSTKKNKYMNQKIPAIGYLSEIVGPECPEYSTK